MAAGEGSAVVVPVTSAVVTVAVVDSAQRSPHCRGLHSSDFRLDVSTF